MCQKTNKKGMKRFLKPAVTSRLKHPEQAVRSSGIVSVNCLEKVVTLSRDIENCTWCSKYTVRQTCGKCHIETQPKAENYFLCS